jgi:hypothetical protein
MDGTGSSLDCSSCVRESDKLAVMGEARQRRRKHADLLAAQPWCVYCGGVRRADTVDHVPPIAMFTMRQRPKGLEFSACNDCNQGTKAADQLVSLIGRMYPSTAPSDAEEIEKLMQGVANNFPGLLPAMLPTPEMEAESRAKIKRAGATGHLLSLADPRIVDALHVFGAKIGMALQYHVTSKILPIEGAVTVRFFTNVNALAGEIPKDLLDLFNSPKTLRQGTKEVGSQFQYESRADPEKNIGLHWATFRFSFAILAAISARADFFAETFSELQLPPHLWRLTRPGAFRHSAGA